MTGASTKRARTPWSMARSLSDTQREAVLGIAKKPNSVDRLPQRTYDGLVRRRIIAAGSGQLTDYGKRVVAEAAR